ncbi:hypothetical protein HPB49_009912 [Dermacentor silvarum]|uniref:Uncharacterized protein n=1 Tax=Dermacentor silvarum TaxID=543639 RepID=A0ACB8D435_DERSI|nr:hypothetical protein HPB49_009912 [Dermacentor silvarum]
MDHERWARWLLRYLHFKGVQTQWIDASTLFRRKFDFFTRSVQEDSERKWAKAVRSHKTTIAVKSLYDNRNGSGLLFEAHAGALPTLVYRRRYDPKLEVLAAKCRACGEEEENSDHLALRCKSHTPSQTECTTLPQALGFPVAAGSNRS